MMMMKNESKSLPFYVISCWFTPSSRAILHFKVSAWNILKGKIVIWYSRWWWGCICPRQVADKVICSWKLSVRSIMSQMQYSKSKTGRETLSYVSVWPQIIISKKPRLVWWMVHPIQAISSAEGLWTILLTDTESVRLACLLHQPTTPNVPVEASPLPHTHTHKQEGW